MNVFDLIVLNVFIHAYNESWCFHEGRGRTKHTLTLSLTYNQMTDSNGQIVYHCACIVSAAFFNYIFQNFIQSTVSSEEFN